MSLNTDDIEEAFQREDLHEVHPIIAAAGFTKLKKQLQCSAIQRQAGSQEQEIVIAHQVHRVLKTSDEH